MLEPWVTQSTSLPAVHPDLSVCECRAARSATRRSPCPVLCHSEFSPLGLSVSKCGATGSASDQTACPVLCHSESGPLGLSVGYCRAAGSASGQTACAVCPTLRQSQSCHSHASPLHPVPISAPPTGLDECLFSISLVSVPLAVRFSVSSGCARRRSVSTYAAILVLP